MGEFGRAPGSLTFCSPGSSSLVQSSWWVLPSLSMLVGLGETGGMLSTSAVMEIVRYLLCALPGRAAAIVVLLLGAVVLAAVDEVQRGMLFAPAGGPFSLTSQ